MDAAAWKANARTQLALAGHRSGGAREEIIDTLAGRSCLTSAQDLYDDLERRVGLASVYRALDALAALRLVHRVDVDGTARYEPADPTGEHHHHAICDRCGRMSPFADEDLERLVHAVGERLGYAVDAHDIVLRGACPDCAGKV
jgi:Fur family transcriptional regulator, ferric uptake regulator